MSKFEYFSRAQDCGNCFVVAPSTAMSCLGQKHGIDKIRYPVDISKYGRAVYTDSELYDYVVKDSGGFAAEIFQHMVYTIGGGPLNTLTHEFLVENKLQLKQYLVKYGPILINAFDTHKNFAPTQRMLDGEFYIDGVPGNNPGVIQLDGELSSKGKLKKLACKKGVKPDVEKSITAALTSRMESINTNSYGSVTRNLNPVEGGDNQDDANTMSKSDDGDGDDKSIVSADAGDTKDTGKNKNLAKTGSHAMVGIGGRLGKNNTTWYLCLNSWKGMPLVELSDKYIKSAGAILHFCAKTTGQLGSLDSFDGYYIVNARPITHCSNIQCQGRGPNSKVPF